MNFPNKNSFAKHQVKIGGLSCSFCAGTIKKSISKLDGVENVNVSISHEEALIQYNPNKVQTWQIEDAIRSSGYTIRDPNKLHSFEEQDAELKREYRRLLAATVLTGISAAIMISMWFGVAHTLPPLFMISIPYLMLGLAMANIFVVGLYILKMAYYSIRRAILNQHVLLEFGAFGGLVGGLIGLFLIPSFPAADFFAVAVFVTTYHMLSAYVSLRVRTKTSQAVRRLLELQPPTARVIRKDKQVNDNEEDSEVVIKVEEVVKGDLVRVRPGEKIPVDGIIVDGFSTVDQSLVTGESVSVEKEANDEVIGGSVNITGTLKVRVTHIGEDSFLQQVARYVEEARVMKPGILQLVDIVLRYYVPGVMIAAGAAFLIWSVGLWAFTGQPDIPRAIFAALAVLVMGYPCALGMATPLALIRGGGMAAEKGILIRSSEAFPALKSLNKIVLDKTGTITKGKPVVVGIKSFNGYDDKQVLFAAAAVEGLSEHPLARAIVKKAEELKRRSREKSNEEEGPILIPQLEDGDPHKVAGFMNKISDFVNYPGKGVKGILLPNSKQIIVGSPRFAVEQGIDAVTTDQQIKDSIINMQDKGQTIVIVGQDKDIVGLIGIADLVKEDAMEAINNLKQAGIEPIMITGDNERTAIAVADQVGIDKVLANVLPNEKADRIRKLQEEGYNVAMVGDGINDAPALMQANVGIAIGSGTDIAIESADVILISDRLLALTDAYFIGKNSYNRTKLNLVLAFTFNGIGVPAAMTGLVHPVWAMIAMMSSVTAVMMSSFGGRLINKSQSHKKKEKKVSPINKGKEEITNTISIKISTIHCENCIESIIQAVSEISGIKSVEGDLNNKMITVTVKGDVEIKSLIKQTIEKMGHVIA
jgi:heavy metal translocating P-type ATPase